MSGATRPCPGCGGRDIILFYRLPGVPVNSVLLVPSREEALAFPRGDLELGFCLSCGFVFNTAFDLSRTEYSTRCEETQAYSGTFSTFQRKLAGDLVERYGLHGKSLIEIGCGKGEFLALLCELGGNRGLGFDPAYVPERRPRIRRGELEFIQDFYSERYADREADFICCKMTLEHIPETGQFMRVLRRSLGERWETTVFFQVPELGRILEEMAFWDFYYEHCSYFTRGSLQELFRSSGFEVLSVWTGYGDQYLMIEARPSRSVPPEQVPADDLAETARRVGRLAGRVGRTLERWREGLRELSGKGGRIALWGSGSKAVAFLTTLGLDGEIGCVVDINPYRQGTFCAGTGQEIVSPEYLREYRPEAVIVMNPIYGPEIGRRLQSLGLSPRLLPVDAGWP